MAYPTELLAIADMLENLYKLMPKDCRFDMGVFRTDDHYHVTDLGKRTEPRCGTAACAAGWAAMLMPHLGLKTRVGSGGLSCVGPEGGVLYDFAAIEYVCGIEGRGQKAIYLFGQSLPDDPKFVAWRIRRFVADPRVFDVYQESFDHDEVIKEEYRQYQKETASVTA